MDKNRVVASLEALANAPGVSGFEDEVVEVLRSQVVGLGRVEEDSLRNLYVYPSEADERPVLMLDAHTDEVGFIVQSVMPNGMLRFQAMGGWVPANVAAQRVRVRTRSGAYVPGVVASQPPHFMSAAEREAPLSLDRMLIDVGASSAEACRELGIGVGAPVVPDVAFGVLGASSLLVGKAFDNRLGCVAVTETLRLLAEETLPVRVVGAFASQEEVGLRGARVTARTVKPSVAIAFEGCPADDTFVQASGAPSQTALGRGPMLRHVDVSMITNPRYQRFVLDLAEELGIPVQEAVRSGGGTNGAAIHLSEQGVPCIVMGIPVRYAHTHYGLCDYEDLARAIELAVEVAKRLTPEVIASF